MTSLQQTFQPWFGNRRVQSGWKVLLLALPALYLSRIGAEFALPGHPAIGVTLGILAGGFISWLHLRRGASPGPSVLFLAFYVLYPWQSPALALACGLFAFMIWAVMREGRAQQFPIEGVIFVLALLLYGLTLAPGVQPADSGEFQLVIARWGVAHPPGYPLYTLLGGIFARLIPWGDMAWRVNLYSAVTGALTLTLLARTVRLETRSAWAGLAAAGILGTAVSFWTTSTQASIRPMTALFAVLMIEAALAYRRAIRAHQSEAVVRRALIRFGLAAGFGVTHHASLFFVGLLLAVAILAARPGMLLMPRRWAPALLAALAGALPWLYLLIRGAAQAPLAPPDLATLDGLRQHVLAAGFAGDMFYYRTLPAIAERLGLILQVLLFQWPGALLLVAAAAFALLAWRDRWLLLALGGAFAVHTLVTATYRAPQTVEYLIPAYVCIAAAVGCALGMISRPGSNRLLYALTVAVIMLGIVWSARPSWISLRAYQARDMTASDARATLSAAPPGSLILANWHHVTPLWYMQQVEDLRPDIATRYVAPAGAEPYLETWARLLSEESQAGHPLITCSYYPEQFQQTGLTFSSLTSCWQIGPDDKMPDAETALASLGAVRLYAWSIPEQAVAGERAVIDLDWWLPDAAPYGEITTFVHLTNENGEVLAQDDQPLNAPDLADPGIITQRYTLLLPRTVMAGTYRLLAGAYRQTPDGLEPLSDASGEERLAIGALIVRLSSVPPVTGNSLYQPITDAITLVGYDLDFSVLGRARLYLHWNLAGGNTAPAIEITISGGGRSLAQGALPAFGSGYLTTAYDMPDVETASGLQLEFSQAGQPLPLRGAWGLPLMGSVALPPPDGSEHYIPVGDIVVTGYAIQPASAPGGIARARLEVRSTNALTQDMSVQFAYGDAARQYSTPIGGAIPTLKWGWSATLQDTLEVEWPPDIPIEPGPLSIAYYDAFTSATWPIFDSILGQASPHLILKP